MLQIAMKIAHELGKTLDEMKKLPVEEFHLWRAYFSITPDDMISVEDKLRGIFGKPKDNG